MKATRKSIDSNVNRPIIKRKLLAAGLIAGLVATLSVLPAAAGSSTDAEITDPVGDANFISAVTGNQGDTRPVSWGNVDLRAVWFETAYSTTKVRDSAGAVKKVDYEPTALIVRIRTEAPVRPLSPWSSIRFKVPVTVPACSASIELLVAATPTADIAELKPAVVGARCNEQGSIVRSPVVPSYDGAVSTLTFPYTDSTFSQIVPAGTVLNQASAQVIPNLGVGSNTQPSDQTVAGRPFTVGQDVPADIDCTASPGQVECSS